MTPWQEITLGVALTLAATNRKFQDVQTSGYKIIACFDDGLEIAWQSEAGDQFSEDTPDLNWEPPTIWVRHPNADYLSFVVQKAMLLVVSETPNG